mgnify:CR=1 FL=1
MRGEYIVGDKAFAKTKFCRVALLGEITRIDGNMCSLKMCGYDPKRRSSKIPHTITTRLDQLDPHADVLKRWESKTMDLEVTKTRVEISKLAQQLKEAMSHDKKIIWKP